MSKMAQKLTGATPLQVLEQMPTLSKESKLPFETDEKTGHVYIELCMSCWLETGEANRR